MPRAKVDGDAVLNFNRRGTRLKIGLGWRDDLMQACSRCWRTNRWCWPGSPEVWAVQTALLCAVKQRIDAGEPNLLPIAHGESVVQGAVKGGAGAP